MATRTIVTSQPDVCCDVCERRLLRGEQPDVFLAAGRRRTVCELCAPRATFEGWMRESDSHQLKLPPTRARRGRGFFDRIRQVAKSAQAPSAPEELRPASRLAGSVTPVAARRRDVAAEGFEDFLDPIEPLDAAADQLDASAIHGDGAPEGTLGSHAPAEAAVADALAVFNASEYPRRVAGVARSLGAPAVNVRVAEHHAAVMRIVVSWELCWYRYEVDLSEPEPAARLLAQGNELDELEADERVGNAAANEDGALAPAFV